MKTCSAQYLKAVFHTEDVAYSISDSKWPQGPI